MGSIGRMSGVCLWLMGVSVVSAGAAFGDPLGPRASCRITEAIGVAGPGTAVGHAVPARLTASVRPVAQVHRNEKANLTISSMATVDGGVQIEGRGAELSFRKKVRPNGTVSLTLEAQHDRVQIELGGSTVAITRGGTTVTVGDPQSFEADLGRVQKMLGDSRAVRLSRIAAAAVQNSEDDSPESAGVIMSDAIVGALTGDVSAPDRAARHLSRHVRAGVRKAASGGFCYRDYENEVWTGYLDMEACLVSVGEFSPMRYACTFRYLVWAESSWFRFLGCTGFGGFAI